MQVAKHPFITPGPSTVFTPPPTRHSTLPGVAQGVLAGLSMTGSLPYHYQPGGAGANGASVSSSGYPTPRPGSAASGFNNEVNSLYMGSPQIGGSNASNLFRSFPRPHSSPKMKLRLWRPAYCIVHLVWFIRVWAIRVSTQILSKIRVSEYSEFLVKGHIFLVFA